MVEKSSKMKVKDNWHLGFRVIEVKNEGNDDLVPQWQQGDND